MAGRPRFYVGTLSAEDKRQLESVANASSSQVRHAQWARTILLSAAGKSNADIAKTVGISTVTVAKILKKWATLGALAALEDLSRSGRPNVISLEDRTWVIALACQLPQQVDGGPKAQLWSMSALTNYIHAHCEKAGHPGLLSIGQTTVWSILNASDIKPHHIKYYLEKKDPLFAEKAREVLLLYKRVEWILQLTGDQTKDGKTGPDALCGEVFISYDEKPGIQAKGNVAPDKAPALGHGQMGRDYEYRRYGTVSLLAGIDLLNGQVTGLVRETHTSEDFIDFLKEIDKKYDQGLKIHIILDNHSVHTSKKVMAFLAKKPGRFNFTFTPKHASWLNLIESFFSKLARQALKHLRVSSKEALIKHIYGWLDEINADPVVYRWRWRLEDIQSAFK